MDFFSHGDWRPYFDHFQVLFSSSNPHIPDVLEHLLLPQISSDMNDELFLIHSDLEIMEALRDIGSHKSPGPDGMPGLFFQHFLAYCGAGGARDG